jgi:hypothetical protein
MAVIHHTTRISAAGCTVLLAGFALLLTSHHNGVAEQQNKDRTGAPGSDPVCTACHNGSNFAPTSSIALLDPATGEAVSAYVPGAEYVLKFTVAAGSGSPGGYAFQATSLLADLSNGGSFAAPSANAQLESVGTRHIVEHNDLSDVPEFTVVWTAPEAGSGPVSVYMSGMAANGNGANSGDGFDGAQAVFAEAAVTGTGAVAGRTGDRLVATGDVWRVVLDAEQGPAHVQGVALDGRVVWERMYCTGECPVPERTAGGVVRIVDAQDGRVRAVVRVPR